MCHFVVPPDADFHLLSRNIWDQVDIDVFTKGNIGYFDGVVEEGDTSIAIDHSGLAQTEDIFGRSVGAGQKEGTKQGVTFSPSPVETNVWGSPWWWSVPGGCCNGRPHLAAQSGPLPKKRGFLEHRCGRCDPGANGRVFRSFPWPGVRGRSSRPLPRDASSFATGAQPHPFGGHVCAKCCLCPERSERSAASRCSSAQVYHTPP